MEMTAQETEGDRQGMQAPWILRLEPVEEETEMEARQM
jgi:hypothetical protein